MRDIQEVQRVARNAGERCVDTLLTQEQWRRRPIEVMRQAPERSRALALVSTTQTLITSAATAVHGRAVLPGPTTGTDRRGTVDATWIPLLSTWPVIPVLEAVSRAVGVPVSLDTEIEALLDLAHDNGVTVIRS